MGDTTESCYYQLLWLMGPWLVYNSFSLERTHIIDHNVYVNQEG